MKRLAAAFGLALVIAGTLAAQQLPEEVRRFRESRDAQMRDPALTVLPQSAFLTFKGLEYFAYGPKFVVAARFEPTEGAQVFMLPTSIGTTREYALAGVLKFEIDGRRLSLKAFRSKTANAGAALFVPFRDQTNGRETYSAGRYLEIRTPSDGATTIDFNVAYNPSCAYGDESYSCPVPPKDNFLEAEIRAGEKVFTPAAATPR